MHGLSFGQRVISMKDAEAGGHDASPQLRELEFALPDPTLANVSLRRCSGRVIFGHAY